MGFIVSKQKKPKDTDSDSQDFYSEYYKQPRDRRVCDLDYYLDHNEFEKFFQ